MGSPRPCQGMNNKHPSISYEYPQISFVGDIGKQTGKIRQTHLWERGRASPDLSPYEQRLAEKLRPLIRRDEAVE